MKMPFKNEGRKKTPNLKIIKFKSITNRLALPDKATIYLVKRYCVKGKIASCEMNGKH